MGGEKRAEEVTGWLQLRRGQHFYTTGKEEKKKKKKKSTVKPTTKKNSWGPRIPFQTPIIHITSFGEAIIHLSRFALSSIWYKLGLGG